MIRILILLAFATPAFAAKIVLVAGGGDGGEGSPAAKAKLIVPFGCDFDSKGRLFFVEFEKQHRLRVIEVDGKVKTAAGTGEKGFRGDNANSMTAHFNGLHGLAVTKEDAVFLADTWNNRIRSYDHRLGKIYNIAGTGEKGFSGDGGPALIAKFGGTFSICIDPISDFLFVTDLDNKRIRRIDQKDLSVITVAGNGKKGIPADGKKAVDEPLFDPRACATDRQGNLYILERGAHALRVVTKDGIIRTVAGTGKAGTPVGKALESQFNGPKHLCIDKENNVIIADAENHRILKYDPKASTIAVVAGTGKKGALGLDGDPLKCELNRPHGVTVHRKTGELYICDSYNKRIVKIEK